MAESSSSLPLAPGLPRQGRYKQQIDWKSLFEEVDRHPDHSCTDVAQRYKDVSGRTLRRRYKQWEKAQDADDNHSAEIAEGKIDGRRYSTSSLGLEGDCELADFVEGKKAENNIVTRQQVVDQALRIHGRQHPHSLRSHPFSASGHFLTRFRRRHGFRTTKHKIKQHKPTTTDQENARIDESAEYLMHVGDAVDTYGPDLLLNADETSAKLVQHPSTSWSIENQPNTVNTTADVRRGVTTMPTVSASGVKLPLQVIVKGKGKRAIENKHLPHDVHATVSESGWQTVPTMVDYMDNVVAHYTQNQPSALILDDYRAHHAPAVQQAAARHNIEIIPVPKGQTPVLQPLDVGINGLIKQKAREKWIEDKQTPGKEPDTILGAVTRVNNALHSIPPRLIQSAWEKSVPSLQTLPR